jgi:adenylate cyclase
MSATPDDTLADPELIADLRRRLAEREAELAQALEQQTATAEVLQVINSSPGNLAPIFDAILEKALRMCSATFGMMASHDNGRLRRLAARGLPAAYNNWRLEHPLAELPPLPRLLAGEAIVHTPDLMAEMADPSRPLSPDTRALVDLAGARSTVIVALRNDDTLHGAIIIFRQEVRPFSDKEIGLLQNFAAQAVIAMENARLLSELRQRTEDLSESLQQQTASAEVLRAISSSRGELQPVFDAMLANATRLCGASYGTMWLRESDGQIRVGARHGPLMPEAFRDKVRVGTLFRPSPSLPTARVFDTRKPVHVVDLKEDRSYFDRDPLAVASVEVAGIRSLLSVPMLKEGAIIGTLNIYRREVRPFTEKQIELMQNFAAQAVIAIENARLLAELRERTDQVAELNRGLEARVAEQVEELGRVGRLKRFLAPQLAELIVSQDNEKILESHRREIVVVFCDLRGYTAFAETAEPEEVLDFLREYHGALGPLVAKFEGTLDQFSGDGIMVFFNDPVPCPDPAERAVKMAVAMREAANVLIGKWRRRGRELGFGAGVAQGYATLGQIGFAERSGYTAIGTVCNLAARLCAEAKDGQILVAQRVAVAVEETTVLEQMGSFALKGLTKPVAAFNVLVPGSGATASPPSK